MQKLAPKIAPEATKTVDATKLIVTMTSGLAGPDFLNLAELIVGESEWFEPSPRPCFPEWRSLVQNMEFGRLMEKLAISYIMDLINDQQKDIADLIKEVRKYIRPLDKRKYPRLPESEYKFWTDEKGNFRHNIAILNKESELVSKIDHIRKRVGLPEVLKFSENNKTREKFHWVMSHISLANSVIAMDGLYMSEKNTTKDAVVRLEDKSLANLVARAFSGKSI